MNNLLLNNPSKLKSLTPLNIFRGANLFYKTRANKIFTLPPGVYKIFGDYEILDYNFFRGVNLPETDFQKNKNYAFYYGDNPNKASVWANGDVLIHNELASLELIDLLLKLHEIGHSYYNSELKCDLFAIEVLKNYGYNDTQIVAALKTIGETERFNCINKILKK